VSGTYQVQFFATATGSTVNWRLLSGNNREAGRGPAGYPDEMTCRRAVRDLREGLSRAQSRVRRAAPNRWTWDLELDGQCVATAGHPFDRMVRCEQALTYFLVGLANASIGRSLRHSGSRRRRDSAPEDERIVISSPERLGTGGP
jgi:hypothetical protein